MPACSRPSLGVGASILALVRLKELDMLLNCQPQKVRLHIPGMRMWRSQCVSEADRV